MVTAIKESLWTQFGASIDMLENAITLYPEELWQKEKKFFYIAYHTLFFLDYYLTFPAPTAINSPLPYTIVAEKDIPADALDDIVPDRIYSKTEVLGYLQQCRGKCHALIMGLTEHKILNERWIEPDSTRNYPMLELLMYNMRHVQHHAAQLNLLLRQKIDAAPHWVSRAKN